MGCFPTGTWWSHSVLYKINIVWERKKHWEEKKLLSTLVKSKIIFNVSQCQRRGPSPPVLYPSDCYNSFTVKAVITPDCYNSFTVKELSNSSFISPWEKIKDVEDII